LFNSNQQGEGTGAFNNTRLRAFANALGLVMNQFNSCLVSTRAVGNVTKDEAQARSLHVNGTPSLFINNTMVDHPMNNDEIKVAIEAALSGTAQ
jgi:protein-disulfide isomerase